METGFHYYEPAAGGPNLAPYSFFNALAYTPPITGFASTGGKDAYARITPQSLFRMTRPE